MSFHSATQQGAQNTVTDTWITPKWVIDSVGISDLDPCAFLIDGKPIVETASRYITESMNGLSLDWGGSVFVNFPYSDSKTWMQKVVGEYAKGKSDIIVLCFNRSDTVWFQESVKYATGINFIKGRISFLDSTGKTKSNGNAPSILIAFGEAAYKRIKNVKGICAKIEK